MLVPKKNREHFTPWAVIDYHKLNKVTKPIGYHMPRIDDILAQMQDKLKFFTVMDLFTGFY